MVAEFRPATYVNLRRKGFTPEFIACVDLKELNHSGFHFNFSLWDRDGINVFVDPVNPDQLSQFGRHWLAGLIEHAPALTALCSPTVNCYRRHHTESAPNFVNWAIERRYTTFRVKIDPGNNVYLENRIPSSACNPHLVMACTVAAGMDGVRRKLTLPKQMDKTKRLPESLEEALDALEADTVLAEILGPKMVELFIFTKRKFELEHFKSLGMLPDEEMLVEEKEYYCGPF
ncbi:glutamine synthetase [Elysia marginata]|uniref:Lengsin n=1 Tax=Elysia marginata TaxID=1093978 RepID=A0AAV4JRW2_9GAST|nr:glutamine synthetase [Elysia marginata]